MLAVPAIRRRHPREVPGTLLPVPAAEARQVTSLVQSRAQGINTTGTRTTKHKDKKRVTNKLINHPQREDPPKRHAEKLNNTLDR